MAGELIAAQVGANQILTDKIAAGEVQPADLGLPVRNETGGILAAGSFVVVNSWNAAQDRALVVLADADVGGHFDVWFLSAALNNNANVTALKKGTLTAVNTAAGAVGDPVYLSTVAGGWVLAAPAGSGARQIVVGRIEVVDAAAGVIEVDLGAQRVPVKLGNADLQAGIVSADATGRALMAANVFDAATLTDKVAADAITAAVFEAKVAAGAISATVDGRAAMAANYFNDATLTDKVAADAITAAVWEAKAAAGAISATVDGRASLAANLLDAATFQDKVAVDAIGTAATSGAAKKFAADCIDAAGAANMLAANSLTEAVLTSAMAASAVEGTKVKLSAAGGLAGNLGAGTDELGLGDDALTTAVLTAKIPNSAIDSTFFSGAEIKFAANALDAAGAASFIANGAIGEAKLEGAADHATNTLATPLFMITKRFAPADFDGNNDVQIYNVNSPALQICGVWVECSTAEGAADTVALFGAANGGVPRISGDMTVNAVGHNPEGLNMPAPAAKVLAANASLFLHGSAAIGVAIGRVVILARTNA